ncbi:hypothetical protein [Microcoleus sp. S36b_B5]|uniref:hypothetical protein n=1 Tax=Microcoleus sp. S36b_B5 TaxID=3055421 RepID=UPI002FCFC959
MNHRFEHGLMVGASFPNNSIASVLSFVPFTARLRNITALGGPCLTDCACLMSRTASAILPSSKVAELVGIKPKGEQFERGNFRFTRAGKIWGQSAWKVEKTVLE